jgi:hypothetical protein
MMDENLDRREPVTSTDSKIWTDKVHWQEFWDGCLVARQVQVSRCSWRIWKMLGGNEIALMDEEQTRATSDFCSGVV